MTREDMEKAVRELYAARLSNNAQKAATHFSAESRFAINGAPEASNIALNVSGKPTIDRLLDDLFQTWEWLEQDMRHILIEGNKAAVHYRLKARFKPTGKVFETEICDMLTFEAGQLKEIIQFLDTALVARLMAPEPAAQPSAA